MKPIAYLALFNLFIALSPTLPLSHSALAVADVPTFTFDQHLLVPVRVHLLRAKDAPNADCKLTPKDIERIWAKAQSIWHRAGIHLVLESIIEEEADNQADYKALGENPDLPDHRQLRPMGTRGDKMFNVYYIHRFRVNGVYMDRASIFVQDTARLGKVEGGIDEPLPRVTSHELGHGLGLPHRQDRTNLMASGTTGTSLNDEEIMKARQTASIFDWVQKPEQLAKQADEAFEAKKVKEARALYERLLAVPGESKLKDAARKRVDQIAAVSGPNPEP